MGCINSKDKQAQQPNKKIQNNKSQIHPEQNQGPKQNKSQLVQNDNESNQAPTQLPTKRTQNNLSMVQIPDNQDQEQDNQDQEQDNQDQEQDNNEVEKLDDIKIQQSQIYQSGLSLEQIENFNKIKESLNGEKYEDPNFQPIQKSYTYDIKEMPKVSNYKWKRITDIYKDEEICQYQLQPEYKDIIQGELGVCYFLGSLSAIASKYPSIISNNFLNQDLNNEGIYTVSFCIDGIYQQVIIDDYFPINEYNSIAFSKASKKPIDNAQNQIWVPILEKAYAKFFKNFQQIVSGNSLDAMTNITGAPSINLKCSEGADKIWDFIIKNEQQGYVQTASSIGELVDGKEVDNGNGIVSKHNYSIIDAQLIQKQGNQYRLVKLRNPWGKTEWTGPWSDKSNMWTEELQEKYNKNAQVNDGIFWIDVVDLIKEFSSVQVNYANDQFVYTSLKVNLDTQNYMSLIKFDVQEDNTEAFIQVFQKDKRHFQQKQNYSYSKISILICKSDFSQWIGAEKFTESSKYVRGNFKKGEYLAFVSVYWSEQKLDADFITIGAYSSKKIDFQQETQHFNDNCQIKILDQMLSCHQSKKGKEVQVYEDDENIEKSKGEIGGYFYYKYENKSQISSKLFVECKVSDIKNMEIMCPFENSKRFQVQVNQGQEKIIKYKNISKTEWATYHSITNTGYIHLQDKIILERLLEKSKTERQQRSSYQVYNTSMRISGGYAFFYQNEGDKTYTENITFKFINMHLINDDNTIGDNKKTVVVKPKQNYMFKIKVIDNTEKSQYSQSYSMSYESEEDKKKKQAENTRKERSNYKVFITKQDIPQGYSFLYENEGKGTYNEEISFTLKNMQVINEDSTIGTDVKKIILKPGEKLTFQLQIIDKTKASSYSQSFSYSYQK